MRRRALVRVFGSVAGFVAVAAECAALLWVVLLRVRYLWLGLVVEAGGLVVVDEVVSG